MLVGYVKQSNIENINKIFVEIEDEFAHRLKIEIKNFETLG